MLCCGLLSRLEVLFRGIQFYLRPLRRFEPTSRFERSIAKIAAIKGTIEQLRRRQ